MPEECARPARWLAIALAAGLAGCAAAPADPPVPPAPDRSAFTPLDEVDRALHALALAAALDAPAERVPHTWRGTGAVEGTITVVGALPARDGMACRRFIETLSAPAGGVTVEDAACRVDAQWVMARPGGTGAPVLAPVQAWSATRTFVTTAQTTIAVVARQHRAPVELVQRLNPDLPARLPSGTRVRLP